MPAMDKTAYLDPHQGLGPQCHPCPQEMCWWPGHLPSCQQFRPYAIPRFSAMRLWFISKASCLSCSACCAISSLATLEVMMKMASLQSMVFPFPSVSRPWERTVTAWSGSYKAGHLFQEVSPEPLCLSHPWQSAARSSGFSEHCSHTSAAPQCPRLQMLHLPRVPPGKNVPAVCHQSGHPIIPGTQKSA